ncbi:porin [Pseudorhodoferax sp.]|uniref:porin n=1 Tax=Pseudorhodoferax sp. TaxID=1993553 RepID=UPI002DD62E8B|nr:porin [Pseudorhodoferax sp.]
MKPTTLSALALAAAAVAAPAFAQSSVTLYGRLNTTVESEKFNGGSRAWKVNDNASRIGFKGVEDMGGGMKASFNLEHGFDADTGSVRRSLNADGSLGSTRSFWAREAWVQMAGGFGSVRLGNFTPESYFATADYISMHNHDTGQSEDKLYDGPFVSANKVGYFTPTMGGFSGSLSVAAGEGAAKRYYDLAANYVGGPLHLGFGYSDQGNTDQWAIRALYELGALTFGTYYQQVDFGGSKYKNARVSAMYAMGASEFHVNFGKATNADQWTLGYNYNLSKRTKIYGYYTDRDTNKSTRRGDINVNNVKVSVSDVGAYSSLAVGVRHNF